MKSSRALRFWLMTTAVAASAALRVEAANYVWAGPPGGAWSNGANWVGGVAPANDGKLNSIELGTNSSSVDDLAALTIAFLQFDGGGNLVKGSAGAVLVFDDGGFPGFPVMENVAGTNTIDKSLALDFSTHDSVKVDAGHLVLAGNLTGYAPKILGSGTGTLSLNGTNTFDGSYDLRIDAGTVTVNSPSQDGAVGTDVIVGTGFGPAGSALLVEGSSNNIANGRLVVVNDDGVFDLNGFSESVRLVEGAGAIHLGAGALTVTDGFFSFDGVMSGIGSFAYTGGTFFFLTGDNTYSGPTTVSGGLLIVNGHQPSSAVAVTGGILVGTGTLGPLGVGAGGTVSGGPLGPPPPNGPQNGKPFGGTGLLSVSGATSFAAGSKLHVDLSGTAAGQFDQIAASGAVTLKGATLEVALGYVPAIGDSFTILSGASLSGTFAGIPEGTNLVIGNFCATVHYGPTSVVLTFSSQKLAATTIALAGSATVCGSGSTASVTDAGGGFVQHQWAYRTTPGGVATPIPNQTGAAYAVVAADFPAPGTFYLVCLATPTCGVPTYSNEITLTVAAAPTPATAGPPQTVCANHATSALGGNAPVVGTGAWSIVGGGTGTFSNASDPNTTFMHTGGAGPLTLRWTISNGICAPSSADVVVTVSQPPSTASVVKASQTICAQGTTFPLGGSTPTVGTGLWSVVSGGTGFFTPSATSPTATFTHTGGAGPVKLRWTISSPPCASSSVDVDITVVAPAPPPSVSGPQTICPGGTTTDLSGGGPVSRPALSRGAPAPNAVSGWSIVSGGTGSFNPDSSTFAATFTHTGGAGPIVLRWYEPDPPCAPATADVVISLESAPPTVTAPPSVIVTQSSCP